MKLSLTSADMEGELTFIHPEDLSLPHPQSPFKIRLLSDNEYCPVVNCHVSTAFAKPGALTLSKALFEKFGPETESLTYEMVHFHDESANAVLHFLQGQTLKKTQTQTLVHSIFSDEIPPLQTAAFVVAQHFLEDKVSTSEIEYLTEAFRDSGETIEFGLPTHDKHSIGGCPGTSKVSIVSVPIVAAAGLLIPKTSTRAITSPSGTIDAWECIAPADFTPDEYVEIAKKTKGIIAYSGGKLGIAPVVDKIIRDAAFPLGIDPIPLLISGILAKKRAVGVDFLVLDIPVGTSKIRSEDEGRGLARRFVDLADRLKMRFEAGLTYGSVPVGHAIGATPEAREAIQTLIEPRKSPASLVEKATGLAGILFELAGLAARGSGQRIAKDILFSGKAYSKFQEIVEAQGGDPAIKAEDIELASHQFSWRSPATGWPVKIDNAALTVVARAAGTPRHPGTGLILRAKKEAVQKGDVVLDVYAHSEAALDQARGLIAKLNPISIEGMLMDRVWE
ncbi:MAG: hypothetical protein ACFFGZ_02570 [Candidatus Thorarchaeota archaeon]